MSNASVEKSILPKTLSPAGRGEVPWAWITIACALLGVSGIVRVIQDRQHQSDYDYKEVCPIDLTKIPSKMGDWHIIKGSDKPLDALTMRITGGSDHIVRGYANDLTGVSLMLLILYGPAEPVLPHTPSVCYPSSGFINGDSESNRMIDYSPAKEAGKPPIEGHAQFLSASYFKPLGRRVLREAVYHSFRLDGQWSPYIGMDRKFPRRNPGIFKIQVQRQVAEGETLGQGDPIEQFLTILLSEIEAEIKASTTKASAAKGLAAK